MSETKVERRPATDSADIVRENQRVAAEGGNIDDLAAALGMTVASLRPRRSTLIKNGVPLSSLSTKPRGKTKVDYEALRVVLNEVNSELGDA